MKPSPADAMLPDLAKSVAPWLKRAATLIGDKLDDAQAHASKSLTDSLRTAPDGRLTRAKARGSRSFQAALNRLTELQVALVWLVRDAREAFYRESFALRLGQVPAELHVRKDPEPTQANVSRFVAVLLHGSDLTSEIAPPVKAASRRLLAALTLAGGRHAESRQQTDMLKAWRIREGRTLLQAARSALTDSRVAAMTHSLQDLIHDDYLDTTPLTLGE